MPAARRTRVLLAGGLVGLGWYLATVGPFTLDPRNLEWLGAGDHPQHVLGLLMFRNAPWSLPLGALPNLAHPLGTTVGFTDANPWVALLVKPFSAWLPADVQVIGPWLALCFALQGIFGALIMTCLTPRPLQRVLGAAMFVAAPPLLIRLGHDTLCAHWLILGMLWLHLRRPACSSLAWAAAFTVLAAGIHPYLAAMVLALALALVVRLWRVTRLLGPPSAAGAAAALGLSTLGAFVLLGYVGWQPVSPATGFGYYSADLLTLVNPMNRSRWFPALPAGPGQYEGFAFLGSGALLAAVLAGARGRRSAWWRRAWSAQWPLLVTAALLAVFALSSQVTVAGRRILSLRTLYGPLRPLADAFRSSGRFAWPLHYVVLTAALGLATRPGVFRPRRATVLLAVAALVQLAELPTPWPGTFLRANAWPRLTPPSWQAMGAPAFGHLVRYPPHMPGVDVRACGAPGYAPDDYVRFTHLAYRLGLTVNGGYLSRADRRALAAYCDALHRAVADGRFDDDTVYVVHPDWAAPFLRPGAGATCDTVEGHLVCVSSRRAAAAFPARAAR